MEKDAIWAFGWRRMMSGFDELVEKQREILYR